MLFELFSGSVLLFIGHRLAISHFFGKEALRVPARIDVESQGDAINERNTELERGNRK